MKHMVNNSRQPLEFVCADPVFCNKDARYFLIENKRDTMGDHMSSKMLEYPSMKIVETPMLSYPILSLIFQPVQWQLDHLVDDDDICGFYFFPYKLLERQTGLYKGYFSTYFDVTWLDQSFLANAGANPGLNYSLVQQSTVTQRSVSFSGPQPWANQRF